MLTTREKKLLKKLAHKLKPLIQIGKNGVTPSTIANINKTLTTTNSSRSNTSNTKPRRIP